MKRREQRAHCTEDDLHNRVAMPRITVNCIQTSSAPERSDIPIERRLTMEAQDQTGRIQSVATVNQKGVEEKQ